MLPRLRRFAVALTGNPSEADDLVQDTVERALRHQDTWRKGTQMHSWLFRIAQNLWIDRVRAQRVRAPAAIDMEKIPVDGAGAMEARLELAAVLRVMSELPQDQRLVVALILVDGMSYREVAELTDVPIGTVMSRLSRARAYLTKRIVDGAPPEGARP